MPRTLVSLGANLGNVRESMLAAKRLLVDEFGESNVRLSRLYRTPPVGGPIGQGDFLNAVAALETDLSIWQVWESIKWIETTLGRQRQQRWEARRIDIDLLLYDQQRVWTPHLKVPHPRMCMRTFVLIPAAEIVSDWIDPVTLWSIAQLRDHLKTSEGTDAPIRILCEDEDLQAALQRTLANAKGTARIPVSWEIRNRVQLSTANAGSSVTKVPSKLTIAAVASPDPETILWEDYSQPWLPLLNLSPTSHVDRPIALGSIDGPRYLMPADDPVWTVHEILAANSAMQCQVNPLCDF